MASGAGGGGTIPYSQVEGFFNSLPGPSAQERIDHIVPQLLSFLPFPYVPAPEVASDDDADNFSLTSSDSEDSVAAGATSAVHIFPAATPEDGEDRISGLLDELLSAIISRLPTKEAARTTVLSTRWRRVWAATPLIVDDAHLLDADGPLHQISLVRSLSRCVDAHPGPVRAARVTHVHFHEHEYALQRLVASLADKNVEDLILLNRPWPLNMPIPDDILRCAALERLYVGVWMFPEIAARAPAAFPNLRELGLFHSIIRDEDFDALLACCHRLDVLSLCMAYNCPSSLRVAHRNLRVAVEWMSGLEGVVVEDAPCLERLLFESIATPRPVKIVHAPKLEVLGFVDLELHALEIGGIAIRGGMRVREDAMLRSLKILAVKVRFALNTEAQLLLTLLKCFPCLETLHIQCHPASLPQTAHCLELWESIGSCECLESSLKTVTFHGFQGSHHEALFIKYIVNEGEALETVAFVCKEGPREGEPLHRLGGNCGPYLRATAYHWSFQNAIDLSLKDPFYLVRN